MTTGTSVQFFQPMPVTNAACCSDPRVMCMRCAAAALAAGGLPPAPAPTLNGFGILGVAAPAVGYTDAPAPLPVFDWSAAFRADAEARQLVLNQHREKPGHAAPPSPEPVVNVGYGERPLPPIDAARYGFPG